jgi:uncharacterized protein YpuA (DUF1002 family)
MTKLEHPAGFTAAVALVTLARATRDNPEKFADQVDKLLNEYVIELDGNELKMLVHSLTVLAANPTSDEELKRMAQEISKTHLI